MTCISGRAARRAALGIVAALTISPLNASRVVASDETIVLSAHRITADEGGFTADLSHDAHFGWATALTGDFDGDGLRELVVGSYGDDDRVENAGAVWIVSLAADGTAQRTRKIGPTAEAFRGPLMPGDGFGFAVGDAGDIDGNGVSDLAVGAALDDDSGTDAGALWILFLDKSGEILRSQKISARYSWLRWLPATIQGGFNGTVTAGDYFGASVVGIGDLDGDGVPELAVGDRQAGRAEARGAVWILFLDERGTVRRHQEISSTTGNFTGQIEPGDEFGIAVAPLGDIDGDGFSDIAVGARGDDDGGSSMGAVWILFLNGDGTVKRSQKISASHGNFEGNIRIDDEFGISLAACSDLDGDTIPDLIVGARGDGDGGKATGAIWLLFLNRDGTVKGHRKINNTHGGFPGKIEPNEWFGGSVTCLDDIDGNGVSDIAVGAEGYQRRGTVWILRLAAP